MAWYIWLALVFICLFFIALGVAYYFMYVKRDAFSNMVREQSEALADEILKGGD